MSHQELLKEYNELNLVRMKIKNEISKGINPNKYGQRAGYPVRFIKWQYAFISQLLKNEM